MTRSNVVVSAIMLAAGIGIATANAAEPIRTETVVVDSWRVTCSEYAEPKQRLCVAVLEAYKKDTQQAVFSWNLATTADGALVSKVFTLTGVSIAQGIDLQIGRAALRKLSYATCEPNHCTSTGPVDAGFRKELTSADTASVVVYGSTGQNMKVELNIKGLDKALAMMQPKK